MTYRRILITRMKYIGDVVLTTPVIRSLREAYPDAHLAYLADAQAASLLENNPFLDEIIPFDFSKDSFGYQLSMYRRMFVGMYDLTIDLYSNPRSALLTFATGARTRIGGYSKGRGFLYTDTIVDDGKPKSAIDYHYQSLQKIGVTQRHQTTELFLTEQEQSDADALLASLGISRSKMFVALHPGGTWPAKLWPQDKFSELARRLSEQGVSVVLSGGPKDGTAVDAVRGNSDAVFLGVVSLRLLAAVYSRCAAVVSNDCGAMHIAAAVGTPTVGIFGPGEERIWFPYVQPHIALRKHVPCNPCHLDVCNREGEGFMECMKLLSVDEVLTTVMERI